MKEALVRFYREVRRRKVGSVALLYALVGWLILEPSDVILPNLGLEELVPWVVVVVLAGFPVSLVVAWIYDITPAGVVRTPTVRELALGARAGSDDHGPVEAPPGSIAVLPFTAVGGAEADTFGDGLTEELISALAHVSGLRVSARTSAFAFKGASMDARDIGRRLKVARLVEGSVRLGSDRLRLSVQLVDATDGGTLWAEVFARETSDLFALQEELAQAIARQLHLETEGADVARRSRHAPASRGAQVAYARGRYHWNRRTEADLRTAVRYFDEALDLAPGFALAHTGLADTHAILLDYGFDRPKTALPELRAAAAEAVRLAPDLGEAQTSWGLACQFSWEWEEAEEAFRRALSLAPSYAVARQRFALFLAWLGRTEEAIEHIEEAERLDPLSLAVSASVGWIHYYARDFPEARRRLEGPLELDPTFASALTAMGSVLVALGDYDAAVDFHRRSVEGSRGSSASTALLGHALGRAGRIEEAERVLGELRAAAESGYVSSYHLALPALGMAREAQAMDRLRLAVEERAPNLMYLRAEPMMDPLRSLTGFSELLEAVGFPD